MFNPPEFQIVRSTDRDCELPVLFEFLERTKGQIDSVIDVGAHYSADYYASELRKYVSFYDALDPTIDPKVEPIVDRFLTDDAETYVFDQYDLVLCLSTIEHIGQYPVRVDDFKVKRKQVFKNCLDAAEKYFWISFPVGLEYIAVNELAIVGKKELDEWIGICGKSKIDIGWYFTEGAQAGYPWKPSTAEKCLHHEYTERLGTQALCILEIKKAA